MNWSRLPSELECEIISNSTFSFSEVVSIARTSPSWNRVLKRCLRYMSPKNPDDVTKLNLKILGLYPNLLVMDYPIIINSQEDLISLALIRLGKPPMNLIIDLTKLTTMPYLDEAIVMFISSFLSPRRGLGECFFTFILPYSNVMVWEGSLCIKENNVPALDDYNEDVWYDPRFAATLDEIMPLRFYTGLYVPEVLPLLEKIVFIVDSLFWMLELDIDIAATINGWPSLRYLGLHPSLKEPQILANYDLLGALEVRGESVTNITYLDYPVPIRDLLRLHRVFPLVKAPLLKEGFSDTIEERGVLLQVNSIFDSFRLLPGHTYPLDLLTLPTQVDYDNTYLVYPC